MMPKLNRFMVMSMIIDIKELVCVANEICSWVGRFEHLSWRYPSKLARDVNAIELVQHHQGTAGEMYILLLELAYDRMHFVLRLIVDFMDNYPFVEDFFKEVVNVKRPGNITLANLVRLLWERLQTLPESISRNLVKIKKVDEDLFVGTVSRGCQVSGSLARCESCSSAGKMVTELMTTLDRVFQENNMTSIAAAERDLLKIDIFDKTQWAAMSRFVDAIIQDVNAVLLELQTARFERETIEKSHGKIITSLKMALRTERNKINALENNHLEVLENIRSVTLQLEEMKISHFEINQENLALAANLGDVENRMSLMGNWNAALQQQIGDLAESKWALEKTNHRLYQENKTARQSCLENDNLRVSLTQLHEENNLIRNKHIEKIDKLEQEVANFNRKQREEITSESIINGEEKCNAALRKIYDDSPILTLMNDPELDMTKQLASNQETIDKLMRQNERLSRTLDKLRDYRIIQGNSPTKH